MPEITHPKYDNQHTTKIVGLVLGPLVLLLTLIAPAPFEGLSPAAWRTMGLATLMAIWWVTEAVPIPVTSFLPMVLSPLLGLASIKSATASFAHPLIFLFMGGFILSLAMERWNLHKRIALATMIAVGDKPAQQVGGFMLVTAFLSMWMSNTATAVMMLPIGLSIIGMMSKGEEQSDFSAAMLLGIAYSASIGGLATLIGTPPNALLAAYLADSYDIHLGFGQWMLVGLPLSVIMLSITWVWLTKINYKLPSQSQGHSKDILQQQLSGLGQMSFAEKAVAVVFVCAALGWIFRPLIASVSGLAISDTGIAMLAAVSLFLIPVDWRNQVMVMDWDTAKKLPWGVLMLFGGGLSLAAQIKSSGLADFIGASLGNTAYLPLLAVIAIVTTAIIFLTEVTSNTATAAGFLPLLGPIALSMGDSPLLLVVPAALAASCAFMMPVATPPNSIVFASGQLHISQMVKAGFALNLVGIVVITLLSYWLVAAILI
ncbi:DASS family sodium-coupled anion symporter [Alginatibacterium sediminis]|uniref:DASS family sodium-coupled anion symporter n=1 Tax=Alginatibacterium sediminis TaxID=2164068 RepID=A0A420EN58_9ALTE|nr:DASS family sodium-coupled anion symporter [Alginatibacterium sediminis]RKF22120.1 DASS family sodium-coupled anion symporter [Alginatibacterium sediminis]